MKSIRRNLTIWLLGGLSLILLAAGAGIYFAVQTSLIKAVDAEMAVDVQVLRTLGKPENEPVFGGKGFPKGNGKGPGKGLARRPPSDRRFLNKIPAYEDSESGAFYQSWSGDGELDEKSASLGERNLPYIERTSPDPVFAFGKLDDDTPVRLLSFRVAPGGKGRPKGERRRTEIGTTIVIGRDLEGLEQTLSTLLGGLVAVGIIAGLGTFALVGTAVNRGLKPLRGLGAQTREIDSNSLDARFNAKDAPAELLPVYDRLNDLLARIESSFDRERRFSSDLAHEMRTPVAELKTMAEVALQWPDKADPGTHQETLEIAQQLESMIENLLALARWESGETPLKP
ncbi:MAG: histidine kinase dimerization/phospho-acceptor domain-containing protein, partial [Verrucomicrobiota bacterium]